MIYHFQIANLIESFGDKENAKDIWDAAAIGSLPAVIFFLKEDPNNINKNEDNDYNWTPMIQASRNGHLKIVQYLLVNGADIDGVNSYGNTALMWATLKGHTSIVEFLLEKGAKINLQSISNRTALHYAVDGNKLDIVKILIHNGANQDLKDENGKTPLDWAKKLRRTSILEFLTSYKISNPGGGM